MRPIAEIRADLATDAPEITDLDAWEIYSERVSREELEDLHEHDALELVTKSRGCAITIPAGIAADPRLTARERFVIAAIEDVRRELDVAMPPRVTARLFGASADVQDRALVDATITSLRARGIVSRTRDGGLFTRGAT